MANRILFSLFKFLFETIILVTVDGTFLYWKPPSHFSSGKECTDRFYIYFISDHIFFSCLMGRNCPFLLLVHSSWEKKLRRRKKKWKQKCVCSTAGNCNEKKNLFINYNLSIIICIVISFRHISPSFILFFQFNQSVNFIKDEIKWTFCIILLSIWIFTLKEIVFFVYPSMETWANSIHYQLF